ncbi:Sister chromatid cohesion protein DCC1 [Exaiptasia diaphana]|nr:Sister chromatid cohesion protein DCC1 [Exaiptasia diaphana]
MFAFRRLEDVHISANAAGLMSCVGPIQLMQFSDSCMSEDYKLLELPPKLLERLQQGESLVIRGDNQEDAVLCTEDSTYEIKLADTSNAMLLTPSCQVFKDNGFKDQKRDLVTHQICSCHSEYYEVRPCRPKLYKIRSLLQESQYKGQEYENDGNLKPKCSLQDILDVVQGSEKEIKESLCKIGALQMDGFWRLLDVEYEEKVVISILTLLEEKDWSWRNIPSEECCDVLEELEPREIIEHCLNRYGERISGEGQPYFALDEEKICRFYAEYLLRPTDRFSYEEFMESWQQSVPDGMTTKEEHLAGIALVDMKSHPPVVIYFPHYNLPEKPETRFIKLFRTRSKWTFDEIQPYIKDLVESGQSLNALLLKYARSSKDESGRKVYNSKKPL